MQELERHLKPLKQNGRICSWHNGCVTPGEEWKEQIKANLETAHIILLLISVDFIESDDCYNIELKKAIQRHKTGNACVIPVILRHCMWEQVSVDDMQLGELQALPKDAKPISKWADRDEAFTSIAEGLFEKIRQLQEQQEQQIQTPLSLLNPNGKAFKQQAVPKVRSSSHPKTPTTIAPELTAKNSAQKITQSTRRVSPKLKPPIKHPSDIHRVSKFPVRPTPKPISRPQKKLQRNSPDEDLTSEKEGITYHKLRNLLKQGKWKDADQETADRMLEPIFGRLTEG